MADTDRMKFTTIDHTTDALRRYAEKICIFRNAEHDGTRDRSIFGRRRHPVIAHGHAAGSPQPVDPGPAALDPCGKSLRAGWRPRRLRGRSTRTTAPDAPPLPIRTHLAPSVIAFMRTGGRLPAAATDAEGRNLRRKGGRFRGYGRSPTRKEKPTDDAFIEAFNGRFRSECLNAHLFLTLADAREKMEDQLRYCNEVRPHGAIGDKPPISLQNSGGATSPLP